MKGWIVQGDGYRAIGGTERDLLNCINACRREWAKMRREARQPKGDDLDQMDYCEHPSWHLEIDDDVDPDEADGVPVCDNCGDRLDHQPVLDLRPGRNLEVERRVA